MSDQLSHWCFSAAVLSQPACLRLSSKRTRHKLRRDFFEVPRGHPTPKSHAGAALTDKVAALHNALDLNWVTAFGRCLPI
jgi:hypothetical protein